MKETILRIPGKVFELHALIIYFRQFASKSTSFNLENLCLKALFFSLFEEILREEMMSSFNIGKTSIC